MSSLNLRELIPGQNVKIRHSYMPLFRMCPLFFPHALSILSGLFDITQNPCFSFQNYPSTKKKSVVFFPTHSFVQIPKCCEAYSSPFLISTQCFLYSVPLSFHAICSKIGHGHRRPLQRRKGQFRLPCLPIHSFQC